MRDVSGSGRKQFLLLDGAPILVHTLRKFSRCPSVTEIVVAVRRDDMDWATGLIENENLQKPVRVVEGGDSRQQSVENALASLAPDTDLVAVHDAVRPFVTVELVEQVIAEAAQAGAAILGIVPVDTVKRVHKTKIRATLDREHLILAQTPQVFKHDLIKQAFDRAKQDNFTGTDEASLIERLEQVEVSVVQGSERNLKITRPGDMELARLYLAQERNPEPVE
jgi:2-C-methyl-D-erythritol 4-phosphate cytidylyltransferase